jgi:hypothetical protein
MLDRDVRWADKYCGARAPLSSPVHTSGCTGRRRRFAVWGGGAMRGRTDRAPVQTHVRPPHNQHDGGAVLDEVGHAACVDAWLERATANLPPKVHWRLFEAALAALGARTKITLGEVTLTAIAARVLHHSGEKFPLLSSLKIEPTGEVQSRELRERIGSVDPSALMEGTRFLLVEFLTVVGDLTAEILTPELHSELSNVVLPERRKAIPHGGASRTREKTPHKSPKPRSRS